MSKALLVQKGKQNVALNEKHVLMYILSPFIVQLFERLVGVYLAVQAESGVSTKAYFVSLRVFMKELRGQATVLVGRHLEHKSSNS